MPVQSVLVCPLPLPLSTRNDLVVFVYICGGAAGPMALRVLVYGGAGGAEQTEATATVFQRVHTALDNIIHPSPGFHLPACCVDIRVTFFY